MFVLGSPEFLKVYSWKYFFETLSARLQAKLTNYSEPWICSALLYSGINDILSPGKIFCKILHKISYVSSRIFQSKLPDLTLETIALRTLVAKGICITN